MADISTPDLKRIINKAFVDQYGEEPDLIRVVRYKATCGGYIKVYPSDGVLACIKDDADATDVDFRAIREEVYTGVNQHISWLKKREVSVLFRPNGPKWTTTIREHVEIVLQHI